MCIVQPAADAKQKSLRLFLCTYNLEECQVLFPPQVLLHVRTHGGQHVISVHEDVNEGVDKAQQSSMSAGKVFNANKSADRHECVMIDVQEGHLSLILSQDKEHGV